MVDCGVGEEDSISMSQMEWPTPKASKGDLSHMTLHPNGFFALQSKNSAAGN